MSSRRTVRPRFDSLRDHADIKAFLERRKNGCVVQEFKPDPKKSNSKGIKRDSMSPDDYGSERGTSDTGIESRRESLASQISHWHVDDSRNSSLAAPDPDYSSVQHIVHSASPQSAYPVKPAVCPTDDFRYPTARHRHHHHHHRRHDKRGKIWRMFWLIGCLIGSFTHFFITTVHYMKYETATETVTGMPLAVKIPATAVCFPIWSLLYRDKLMNNSACLDVTTIQHIEDCETELFGQHHTVFYVLHNLTKNPIDLIDWIEIRKPTRKLEWITDEDLIDPSPLRRYRKNQTNVKSYYRGPDKCISFHPIPLYPEREPEQLLSIDRMATSKARTFFSSAFKVNRELTPEIHAVRLFVHESRSYPRGTVTLPIVANLTKDLSFTISYTKIETTYLPAPYFSKCIDYSTVMPSFYGGQQLDSKQHCTSRCVRHQTKADPFNPAIPSNHLLMRDISTLTPFELSKIKFMPSDDDSVDEAELECAEKCNLDCITRTYYTTLSASDIADDSNNRLHVKMGLENPETTVRFIPKLDFEAYVIYVAGVFSIWFSASVYHLFKDSVIAISDCVSSHRRLLHLHHEEVRKGLKANPVDSNDNNGSSNDTNKDNVMSY